VGWFGLVERMRLVNYVYVMMDCIYSCDWTCNVSLYNALVLVVRFELYMFWSDLNYIYMFWSNLNYKFEFFLRENVL
jgi:hypothetical protein